MYDCQNITKFVSKCAILVTHFMFGYSKRLCTHALNNYSVHYTVRAWRASPFVIGQNGLRRAGYRASPPNSAHFGEIDALCLYAVH